MNLMIGAYCTWQKLDCGTGGSMPAQFFLKGGKTIQKEGKFKIHEDWAMLTTRQLADFNKWIEKERVRVFGEPNSEFCSVESD